jgi:hypothetical protein
MGWIGLLAIGIAGTSCKTTGQAEGKFVKVFPEDGVPQGWSVRAWDDVSKQPAQPTVWKVEAGILNGGEPRGTWLVSDREYGDYELEFEWKLGPRGNSGCGIRFPAKGDPAFDGMELQMADVRYNPEAKDSELTGGIYRAIAPRVQVYKPEQWNKYHLTLKGEHLTAILNGTLIQDIDLNQQNQIVKRHNNTDAPPVKDRPRRGHIGFQELSRGEEHVQIRNAKIKVLD